jgi:hypothetical protein
MTRVKARYAVLAASIVTAGGLAIASSPAVSSVDGSAVRGEFHAFAAGAGRDIGGHAQLVRRKSGSTFVAIHVAGLAPGGQYASHVHKQACANGDADGHFQQNGPGAGTTPPNEIWPGDGPWLANAAGNANVNTTADYVANADAISVVVHDLSLSPTANKVACADLGA